MKLVASNDPILKQVCDPVESNEPLDWIDGLCRICQLSIGVGISASQVGIKKRVAYIDPNGRGGNFIVNPEIVNSRGKLITGSEGCLSFPGVFTSVQRHEIIDLRFQPVILQNNTYILGDYKIRSYDNFEARVIQHEVDHMNGICKVGEEWHRRQPKNYKLALAVARTRIK